MITATAIKQDTFTTTSTSFVDVTGLSVTITPTSVTQAVLINFFSFIGNQTNDSVSYYRVAKAGSMVNPPSGTTGSRQLAHGMIYNFSGTTNYAWPVSGVVVDVPGVTTPVTYTLQVRCDGRHGTVTVNKSGGQATGNDADTIDSLRASSYLVARLLPATSATAIALGTFTSTSTSFTDVTGLSVTVTPQSVTQPVVIEFGTFLSNITTDRSSYYRIAKAGTMVNTPSGTLSNRLPALGSIFNIPSPDLGWCASGLTIEVPGVTTPVTYTFQVRCDGRTGTVTVNRTGADTDTADYGIRTSSCLSAMLGAP